MNGIRITCAKCNEPCVVEVRQYDFEHAYQILAHHHGSTEIMNLPAHILAAIDDYSFLGHGVAFAGGLPAPEVKKGIEFNPTGGGK